MPLSENDSYKIQNNKYSALILIYIDVILRITLSDKS